jgi:RNA polymerase sigma-70 factor, ECF subfamily
MAANNVNEAKPLASNKRPNVSDTATVNGRAGVHSVPQSPDLNQYRGYLRALTQVELGRRLQSKVDPSDIVQQSLLEAHQDLAALKGRTEPELIAWLRTILARNLLNTVRDFAAQKRDIRREQSLIQQLNDSSVRLERFLAADQTSPSQQVIRGEEAAKLATALAQLPDDQRTAVILKHFHGRSLAQIAEQLDRSTLAVAGLLKRGLKKLRQLMDTGESSSASAGN